MEQAAQEKAWAGGFGDDYHKRSPGSVEWNLAFFKRVFPQANSPYDRLWTDIHSILELGAGSGATIRAVKQRFPTASASVVEINHGALRALREASPEVKAIEASVLEWQPETQWDLVLTKGFLIHVPPTALDVVYETLHKAMRRYLLIAEYYNPTPVEVPYRGQAGMLWKRDFAGELLDKFEDLRLVNYGFAWHRDRAPQDDITWFLMERV